MQRYVSERPGYGGYDDKNCQSEEYQHFLVFGIFCSFFTITVPTCTIIQAMIIIKACSKIKNLASFRMES